MNDRLKATGIEPPADLSLTRGNLLVVGTGAFGVTMLPAWMAMLRAWYPNIAVETILTENAERLVQRRSIEAVTRRSVHTSFWDESGVSHRDLADWADLVLVVPATMDFMSKLSLGITDSLALYVVPLASSPVVIVPSAPERMISSITSTRHLRNLKNVGYHVMPTRQGIAVSSNQLEGGGMANIHEVVLFAAEVLHEDGGRSSRD